MKIKIQIITNNNIHFNGLLQLVWIFENKTRLRFIEIILSIKENNINIKKDDKLKIHQTFALFYFLNSKLLFKRNINTGLEKWKIMNRV